MIDCFIALGSNLERPLEQLRSAVLALRHLACCELRQVSPVYCSEALGPAGQPDYLNAVVMLGTALQPLDLLDTLQQLETAQGRIRDQRWGPRTLDLDILLYGNSQIDQPRLIVPHPQMRQRNFVLYPLRDICGDNFVLPDGTELGTLVKDCPAEKLSRLELQLHDH